MLCSVSREAYGWPEPVLLYSELCKRLCNKPAMSFAHPFFGNLVASPFGNAESWPQRCPEIPIGQIGEIECCHGMVAFGEALHSLVAECS